MEYHPVSPHNNTPHTFIQYHVISSKLMIGAVVARRYNKVEWHSGVLHHLNQVPMSYFTIDKACMHMGSLCETLMIDHQDNTLV